jgi:hypothetical protein
MTKTLICAYNGLKNIALANYLASDSLVFVDVSTIIAPPSPARLDLKKPTMRPVYDAVTNALNKMPEGTRSMVILDDITSLEWIGFSSPDLGCFSRALRSLCFKVFGLGHNF